MVFRIPAQNGVLHALQVLAHAIDAQRFIARLERFENLEVFRMIALARSEDAEDQTLLVGEQIGEYVEQLRKHCIPRRTGDLTVKAHVHFVQHTVIAEVLAGSGEQTPHLDEIFERRVANGVGDGLRLEWLSNANEVEEELLRDGAGKIRTGEDEHLFAARDVDARAVPDLDEAHRLELLERFADRGMADAETPSHFHDGRKPIAALIVPLLDHPADALSEFVRQALFQHRSERVSHVPPSAFGLSWHWVAPLVRFEARRRAPALVHRYDRTVRDNWSGHASASCSATNRHHRPPRMLRGR